MKIVKPQSKLELEGKTINYRWLAPVLEKKLSYHTDKCFGCGLCEIVCPVKAISMGPVKDIASGRVEAPYIIIDETKCIACPLCSSVCPSKALKLTLKADFPHPRVKGNMVVDREKCIPCLFCEKICPRRAIRVNINIKKKSKLVKYLEEGKVGGIGTITIDLGKCCYCGLCELLCDAIKIEWTQSKPPHFKLGVAVLVDESKCDYCGLCEKICPVKAIKVECKEAAPREVSEPEVDGSIDVDEEKCVWCGLCTLCPVGAIKVEKQFKGDVYMVQPNNCDPSGCKNCINICPTNVVYVAKPPSLDKMLFVKDYCIYCGACEKACPVNAIRVARSDLRFEDSSVLWFNMSYEYFKRMLTNYKSPKPAVYYRAIKVERVEITPPPPPPKPLMSRGFNKAVNAIERLKSLVNTVHGRVAFERGRIDEVLSKLRR